MDQPLSGQPVQGSVAHDHSSRKSSTFAFWLNQAMTIIIIIISELIEEYVLSNQRAAHTGELCVARNQVTVFDLDQLLRVSACLPNCWIDQTGAPVVFRNKCRAPLHRVRVCASVCVIKLTCNVYLMTAFLFR